MNYQNSLAFAQQDSCIWPSNSAAFATLLRQFTELRAASVFFDEARSFLESLYVLSFLYSTSSLIQESVEIPNCQLCELLRPFWSISAFGLLCLISGSYSLSLSIPMSIWNCCWKGHCPYELRFVGWSNSFAWGWGSAYVCCWRVPLRPAVSLQPGLFWIWAVLSGRCLFLASQHLLHARSVGFLGSLDFQNLYLLLIPVSRASQEGTPTSPQTLSDFQQGIHSFPSDAHSPSKWKPTASSDSWSNIPDLLCPPYRHWAPAPALCLPFSEFYFDFIF